MRLPGSAARITQVSVFPLSPARRRPFSSSGWTWTERFWLASMNFTRSGNCSLWPTACAEDLFGSIAYQFAQRRAGQRTIAHHADLIVIVRQLPALGVVRFRADVLMQDRSQAAPPPDEPPQDRFEMQGVERNP